MVKSSKQPNRSTVKKTPPLSATEKYRQQIRARAWTALNYMTVPLASCLTFGWVAVCEFLLYKLLWALLQEDLKSIPQIQTVAEFGQIAIFVVSLIGMLVHTGFSLYGTFQTEKVFAQEEATDEK